MFESATIKLTGWYLLIIMVVSLLFSGLVYQTSLSEFTTRFDQFRQSVADNTGRIQAFQGIRDDQLQQASKNILLQLLYINLVVLIGGGVASYLLARRTLQPIEDAHEAQSRFTSDASHELRTPLAVMKSELEVALRDPKLTKADMRELLESNLEEVDTLTQLAQTLLALSRLDIAALPTETISLPELVETVAKRLDIPKKRLQTTITSKKQLLVTGNIASLSELLTILFDNALKYSPKNSPINVTQTMKGQRVQLTISNQGEGITDDDLPHIFERFYRADHARTKPNDSGYGLGLSLAKRIVELHNGSIAAMSKPGVETTFTVFLPAEKDLADKTTLIG